MFKSSLVLLCCCVMNVALGASVTMVCPDVSAIQVEKQPFDEPWRAYHYSTTIVAPGLPGGVLAMEGLGGNKSLSDFLFATWTDSTFLCWYSGPETGDVVLTNAKDFSSQVESCRFPTTKERSRTDCVGGSPLDCPMVCELTN